MHYKSALISQVLLFFNNSKKYAVMTKIPTFSVESALNPHVLTRGGGKYFSPRLDLAKKACHFQPKNTFIKRPLGHGMVFFSA
jgi:hypothetical protein